MSKFLRGRVLLGLLSIPSSASAQIAGGHSGISSEYAFSGRQAYDDLNAFGSCFAAQQTKDALRLIATEAGSVDEARVYKQLFSKEQFCLGDLSALSVPWQYVRGAVAEGFFDRKMPLAPNLVVSGSLPAGQVKSVMDAAFCYTGKHPQDARKLIETTKPATPEEAAAFDALWTDFEACLPSNMPAGYKFDTVLLRYRIAEALWRQGQVHS
jgi:hypothetical protein